MSSKRYYQIDGDGKGYQLWRLSTTHQLGKALRVEAGIDNIFNYVDRTMRPYHLGNNTSGTTVYGTVSIKFKYGKRVSKHTISTKQNSNYEENSD